jgi:hypothetical protein
MATLFAVINQTWPVVGPALLFVALYALWRVIKAVWRERKQNHRKVCPMWIRTQAMGINAP